MKKTAIILGATGLVGSELLNQLLQNDDYNKVITFVRRPIVISHSKLQQEVIDFDKPELWAHKVVGDVLFSAFGTTIKKAGSKAAQYMIDYTYQFQMAEAAARNGVSNYVLVSSVGAHYKSKIFYSRIKGELDRDVQTLGFKHVTILKPSILAGKRNEKRAGEKVGLILGKFIAVIPGIRKYKPIPATIVAKAMINAAKSETTFAEYELLEVFGLGER